MIDGATQERLQQCVRRESRSFLQYVREVPMWSGAADRPAAARLREMAQAELNATENLAKWLQKRRAGLSHLGPFPSVFTDSNDAALHFILPKVIREHAADVARLETDSAAVTDPEAKSFVDAMLALKRKNQPELAGLSAKPHTIFK